MINYSGRIKDSLAEMQTEHPDIKATIMGTRKTDPYSGEDWFYDISFFFFPSLTLQKTTKISP